MITAEAPTARKWTSTAGPIQTKRVNKAISAFRWRAKTVIEVTDHGRHEMTMMIGGDTTPESVVILDAIAEKYGWNVTRDNAAALAAEIEKATIALILPEVDTRTTPEERAEIARERAEREAKQSEASTIHAAEYQRCLADLKRRYPNAKQEGSGHARAAANIKRELTAAFPGIKFTVKSDSFSGGNSVDIGWTDGPTTTEVKAISDKYQYGHFDGMIDLYKYNHSAFQDAVGNWLGSAKYVQEQRELSESLEFTTARLLCEAQHIEFKQPEHVYQLRDVHDLYGTGDTEDLLTHVYRVLQHVSFPPVYEVVGLKEPDDDLGYRPYTLELKVPEKAATTAPTATGNATIERHHHTKHGFDFHLVIPSARLDEAAFAAARSRCEAAGGWYSRRWGKCPGGFAFKDEDVAKEFAATL